jgi:hypothetical protein
MPVASVGIPADRMQSWGWQQFFTYAKVKGNKSECITIQVSS